MENNKDNKKPWWRDGVILFSKVSAYIAIPVIVASYVGKFLDNKYNTGSFLFYTFIGLAFFSTIYLIWREVKIYQRQMESEQNKKKEENNI